MSIDKTEEAIKDMRKFAKSLSDGADRIESMLNKAENKEPEVDWDKVPAGTMVLLQDLPIEDWRKAVCLGNGNVILLGSDAPCRLSAWGDRKLDPEAESIINWIPNKGFRPKEREGFKVIVAFQGNKEISDDRDCHWGLGNSNPITDYAYVRLPV